MMLIIAFLMSSNDINSEMLPGGILRMNFH